MALCQRGRCAKQCECRLKHEEVEEAKEGEGGRPRPSPELLGGGAERNLIENLLVNPSRSNREGTLDGPLPGGRKRPAIEPLPESSVLARLRQFLPQMAEANERLEMAMQVESREAFDIEVLTGGEDAPHIQMDLNLGIAELRTAEAVAVAERLVNGHGGEGEKEVPSVSKSCDKDIDSESGSEGEGARQGEEQTDESRASGKRHVGIEEI